MNEYNIVDIIRYANPELWTQACEVACERYNMFPASWQVPTGQGTIQTSKVIQ